MANSLSLPAILDQHGRGHLADVQYSVEKLVPLCDAIRVHGWQPGSVILTRTPTEPVERTALDPIVDQIVASLTADPAPIKGLDRNAVLDRAKRIRCNGTVAVGGRRRIRALIIVFLTTGECPEHQEQDVTAEADKSSDVAMATRENEAQRLAALADWGAPIKALLEVLEKHPNARGNDSECTRLAGYDPKADATRIRQGALPLAVLMRRCGVSLDDLVKKSLKKPTHENINKAIKDPQIGNKDQLLAALYPEGATVKITLSTLGKKLQGAASVELRSLAIAIADDKLAEWLEANKL